MRALGIDFGEQRIGLAITDPRGLFALPLTLLERSTDRRAVYQIADLARREQVEALVLGEPRGGPDERKADERTPDDRPSVDPASRIRRFGAKLERASGLPLFYVDESLTTVEAASRLHDAGADLERSWQGSRGQAARGARADGRRDLVAAQIILQDAIAAGLLGPAAPPIPTAEAG